MPRRRVLLLDVDGVLLDHRRWSQEVNRLAKRSFCAVLGGHAERWIEHQFPVWRRVWEKAAHEQNPEVGLRRRNMTRWWDRVHADWIEETCVAVGVEPPPTFEERVDASERIHDILLRSSQAVYAGAGEAISVLAGEFEIHMASGNPSFIVELVLERLGVRDRVGIPYGSDLAAVQKGHPQFYPNILEGVGCDGDEAIVVDDADRCLTNAARSGILGIKVGDEGEDETANRVATIAELPDLLRSL